MFAFQLLELLPCLNPGVAVRIADNELQIYFCGLLRVGFVRLFNLSNTVQSVISQIAIGIK